MVQSNVDGRSRTRRTKQSEEQAPLVESYLSSNSSTIYHGNYDYLRNNMGWANKNIRLVVWSVSLNLQEAFVLGVNKHIEPR